MPWRYATQGSDGRKDASVVHAKDDLSSAKVTNISGTSNMTRSRWIFAAPEPPVWSKDPKGKAKAGVEESDKTGPIPDEEWCVIIFSYFLTLFVTILITD